MTAPARAPVATAVPYRPPGDVAARVGRWKIVLFALVALAVVVAVANVVVLLNEPGPAEPDCQPNRPCLPPSAGNAVRLGQPWVSRDLGYSFEYPTDRLQVMSEDGSSVHLEIRTDSVESELWISGTRATEHSIDELLRQRRDALAQRVAGLEADNDSAQRVVAPALGFVRGVGGAYAGTLDNGSTLSKPATVVIMAAGDGKVNLVLSLLIAGEALTPHDIEQLRGRANLVVDTMRWR